MEVFIYIALLGWIPISLLLFMVLPPQRAVVVGVVGGWLCLPPSGIGFSGLPDYDKVAACTLGVVLGTLIFQPNRLLAFRLRWFDLPAVLWCLCPFMSSVTNGLGVYDGLSAALLNIERWTLPYLIGRLYFGDLQGMRELAVGIAVGGIIWILPCLFEVRMSPILLSRVYGLHRFEGMRLGNWRPFVFFSTGLELGMWMTASSLSAVWLWRCGSLKRLGSYRLFAWSLPILLITTFYCRATGAFALLIAGLSILWLCTRFGSKLLFCALLLVPPLFYAVRIPGYWSGNELVAFIETYISKDRADSLAYRFTCEDRLIKKAMVQPIWGWGGWGRNRVVDPETGRDLTPTDSVWIIYLGYYGGAGLLTWTTMLLLPSWLFVLRVPVRQWRDPAVAPMSVLAMLPGLYMVDSLLNGSVPLGCLLACGGLVGAVSSPGRRSRARRGVWQANELAGVHGPSVMDHDPERPAPDPVTQSASAGADGASATTPQRRLAGRHRQLASKLRSEGRLADAKAMLSHACDLLSKLATTQPADHEIQTQLWDCANDLAWLLLNEPEPGDLHRAVGLARQATEADAERAAYWNTLGAACFRVGDTTGAITALERSMALNDGGTAFDCVLMSLAHSRAGHQAEACHWLARTESGIEGHGSDQPDLSRLIEEARRCLTAK